MGCLIWHFVYTPYIFPPTLLINLAHRTDRIQEIQKDFKFWPTPIERVAAVKRTPGWKGCSASHLKCIQLAKDRGYPWVLILEDDCSLTPQARRRFEQLLPLLWNHRTEWDIFYGGPTFLTEFAPIADTTVGKVFKVKGFTTHFCLVHAKTYNRILNLYPKNPGPIDVFYADHLRIWTVAPYLAKQRVSPSDIGTKGEYTHLFIEAENKLLQN